MLDMLLKIQTLEQDIPDKLQCPLNLLDEFFSSLCKQQNYWNNPARFILAADLNDLWKL